MNNNICDDINALIGKNILFLDLETTGFPGKTNPRENKYDFEDNVKYDSSRIVQIGWCYYENFDIDFVADLDDVISIIRKPVDFDKMPYMAYKVHGISYDKAVNEGTLIGKILNGEFGKAMRSCDYIFAYNATFDVSILANEIHRAKFTRMYNGVIDLIENNKIICMLALSNKLLKPINNNLVLSRKQKDIYFKCYGEYPDAQHDARGDVFAMMKILEYMISNELKTNDEMVTISKSEYYELLLCRDTVISKNGRVVRKDNNDKENNRGQPWTAEEIAQLRNEYTIESMGVNQIAEKHKRTMGGITSRLKKLGIIENDDDNLRTDGERVKVIKTAKNKS